MVDESVNITLPNKLRYLPVILSSLHTMGKILGFTNEAISDMEVATEEAVTNVIKYAFREDEDTTFEVAFESLANGLVIKVKEKGMPYEPLMIHEFNPELLLDDSNYRGLGTFLMNHLMDDVTFHNLGRNGNELHLVKYFDQHIKQLTGTEKHPKAAESETQKLPDEDNVSYTVRRMKSGEEIEVSKVAYVSYGYSYFYDTIYYPDRLRDLNLKDDIISFVAVKDTGEIIAHTAFERGEDKNVPELGMGFTNPKYRGKGCLNNLTTALLTEAEERKFTGIFAQAVTTHPFSQKTMIKFGFRECALLLSVSFDISFRDIEQKKAQRESLLVSFRYVMKPDKLVIYPPGHHKEIITGLYDHIGIKPAIEHADMQKIPENDESILFVIPNQNFNTANIWIKAYGKNIIQEVYQIFKHLCVNRTETIYLKMRLNDPFTAKYTAEFEKMGFFFSGILPQSKGNDVLILQYLNNYVIDFNQLKIASDKGAEIVEYVKRRSALL